MPHPGRCTHEVIVACIDGSPGGYDGLAEAAELAKRFGARLVALSVEEGLPRYPATMGEVDDFKREKDRYFETVGVQAARIAGRRGLTMTHQIRVGHAADAIVQFVDQIGADLVVLGYKGHSRVAQLVIGTTAQKVNAYSKASVMIVKQRETETAGDDETDVGVTAPPLSFSRGA